MIRSTTSASNLHRRQVCPGSHAAEDGRTSEDSEYSTEGTLLHDLDANPDPEREAQLTTEQREVLNAGRKADDQIFMVLCKNMNISEHETFEEGHEKELWLRRGLRKILPGHCDRWRYYPRLKILVIIDKKFGYLDVTPAEANLQLRAYAVMGASVWDCDHVLVAINQPRLDYEHRLSLAEYSREDIAAAREQLIEIWDACQVPDAPRNPEEEACRYCLARVDCDAYKAKYVWLSVPSQDGQDIFKGKLAATSDTDLDTVWKAICFAVRVQDAVKAEILRRHQEGGMPMYEVADSGKTSTINDTVQAASLLKAAGFSEAEIMACAKLSKTRLAEKLLLRRSDIHSVPASKKALQEILKPALTVTEKDPFLKRRRKWQPVEVKAEAPAKVIDNGSDAELFPR